jgi:hypothetical protein
MLVSAEDDKNILMLISAIDNNHGSIQPPSSYSGFVYSSEASTRFRNSNGCRMCMKYHRSIIIRRERHRPFVSKLMFSLNVESVDCSSLDS